MKQITIFTLCILFYVGLDARQIKRDDVTNPVLTNSEKKDAIGKTICDYTIPPINVFAKPLVHNLTVACEKIENNAKYDIGERKACYLQNTGINLTGIRLSSDKDETVEGMELWKNKKILYLPESIAPQFPNLVVYNAYSCSILAISRINFRGLKKLQGLYLGRNQIEKIDNGTFDDLEELEVLSLFNNKIAYMNGVVFFRLVKLVNGRVLLSGNLCINRDIRTVKSIEDLSQLVTKKCGISNTKSIIPYRDEKDRLCYLAV